MKVKITTKHGTWEPNTRDKADIIKMINGGYELLESGWFFRVWIKRKVKK